MRFFQFQLQFYQCQGYYLHCIKFMKPGIVDPRTRFELSISLMAANWNVYDLMMLVYRYVYWWTASQCDRTTHCKSCVKNNYVFVDSLCEIILSAFMCIVGCFWERQWTWNAQHIILSSVYYFCLLYMVYFWLIWCQFTGVDLVDGPLNRVSTTCGNLLEFEIPSGNTGNLLEFICCSWKFLYNRSMINNWHDIQS